MIDVAILSTPEVLCLATLEFFVDSWFVLDFHTRRFITLTFTTLFFLPNSLCHFRRRRYPTLTRVLRPDSCIPCFVAFFCMMGLIHTVMTRAYIQPTCLHDSRSLFNFGQHSGSEVHAGAPNLGNVPSNRQVRICIFRLQLLCYLRQNHSTTAIAMDECACVDL